MFQQVASLLKTPYKGELCSSFFQVVELQLCTRAVCGGVLLLETLPMKDVSEKLHARFVGFASNDAAAVLG